MKLKRSPRILVVALVAALFAALAAPTVALATPTQSDLDAAKAKLDDLYSKAAEASENLNATNVLIDQTTSQINSLNDSIASTQASIDETEAELASKRAVLSSTVEKDYKEGNTSLLSIVLNASSFDDLVTRVYYMNKVNAQRSAAISETRDLETQLNEQKDDLSSQKASLEAQKAQQEQLASQQQAEKDELSSQVSSAESYVNTLNSEIRAALQREQEEQEAASRAAAEAARASIDQDAANASSGGSSSSSTSGGSSSSDSSSGGSTPSPAPSGARQTVINAAYSMLGGTYVWGASNPATKQFDCSGLTMYCFGQAGISLPHNNLAQMAYCKVKSNMSDWQPGDLIFWPAHVAIYMGNGMMIDAGSPRTGVSYRAVYGGYYGAGWPSQKLC